MACRPRSTGVSRPRSTGVTPEDRAYSAEANSMRFGADWASWDIAGGFAPIGEGEIEDVGGVWFPLASWCLCLLVVQVQQIGYP